MVTRAPCFGCGRLRGVANCDPAPFCRECERSRPPLAWSRTRAQTPRPWLRHAPDTIIAPIVQRYEEPLRRRLEAQYWLRRWVRRRASLQRPTPLSPSVQHTQLQLDLDDQYWLRGARAAEMRVQGKLWREIAMKLGFSSTGNAYKAASLHGRYKAHHRAQSPPPTAPCMESDNHTDWNEKGRRTKRGADYVAAELALRNRRAAGASS